MGKPSWDLGDWFKSKKEDDPEIKIDPYVKKVQDILFPIGQDILSGKIPEYYKGIGEVGGSELERMLSLVGRDITKGVDESLARRNVSRGGIATSLTSKSIADASTKLRWSDFNRAMAGKQSLLGVGSELLTGVRSSATNISSMTNQFDLNAAQLAANKENAQNSTWTQILSSGIGSLGNLYGYNMLKDYLNPSSNIGSAGGGVGIATQNKKNLMSLGEDYFNFG